MALVFAINATWRFRILSLSRTSMTALKVFSYWLRSSSYSSNFPKKDWATSNTTRSFLVAAAPRFKWTLISSWPSRGVRTLRKLMLTTSNITWETVMANTKIIKFLWRWRLMRLFKLTAENLKRSMVTNGSHLLLLGFWIIDLSRYSLLRIRCRVKYRWEMVSFYCLRFHQALAQR